MSNNEEKKIELIGWCDRYLKIKDEKQKEDYVRGILKRDHVPFAEKMLICKEIAMKSLYINNEGVGYIDMNINEINFTGMIIALYTKLDFPLSDDGKIKMFECYEYLRTSGAIDGIVYVIGKDVEELLSINERCLDAIAQEHCSTQAFISRQIGKFLDMSTNLTEFITNNIE